MEDKLIGSHIKGCLKENETPILASPDLYLKKTLQVYSCRNYRYRDASKSAEANYED